MTDWISVEDRLPEDCSWILCYGDGAMATYGYSSRRGFENWDEKQAAGLGIDEIAYWQQLPNPPEVTR